MFLYNLKQIAHDQFQMAKFDDAFNVAAVYEIRQNGSGWSCNCPASQRVVKLKPCKHQKMIKFMLGAVNTDRFFNPETGMWCTPVNLPDDYPAQSSRPAPVPEPTTASAEPSPPPPAPPEPTVVAAPSDFVRRI